MREVAAALEAQSSAHRVVVPAGLHASFFRQRHEAQHAGPVDLQRLGKRGLERVFYFLLVFSSLFLLICV